MKFEQYTTGTSWQVLKSIAEKPRSASEIARTIGASIANVSQRARLLEAHGVITRTKEQHAGKGKPHQRYAITKPVTLLASIAQGTARKRTFTPNEFQEQLLNILNWPRQEDQFFLLKFLCLHEELVSKSRAIAVSDANKEEIHLIIITTSEELENLRQKSKAVIEHSSEKRIIICWTHTEEEVRTGLERNEEYYVNHLRKPYVLIDPEQVFRRLKWND